MSDANQWMPLYVGDYLADTMHLTGPEHGAYLLLLMHSWRTGALPDDDRKLAAIARTDAKAWAAMRDDIMAFFTRSGDGFIQGRLERVRAEQGAKVEQRRAAGRASALARKGQRGGNEGGNDTGNETPTGGQRETNGRSTSVASPLPSRRREPEPEEEIPSSLRSEGRSKPDPRGHRLPDDWLPDPTGVRLCAELGLDLSRTLAQFRDHWRAKPGKDACKLDWDATWRTWCRRERPPRQADSAHARRAQHTRDAMRADGITDRDLGFLPA